MHPRRRNIYSMNIEKITVRITESGKTMDVVVLSKHAHRIEVVLGEGVHSVRCELKPTPNRTAFSGKALGREIVYERTPRAGAGRPGPHQSGIEEIKTALVRSGRMPVAPVRVAHTPANFQRPVTMLVHRHHAGYTPTGFAFSASIFQVLIARATSFALILPSAASAAIAAWAM